MKNALRILMYMVMGFFVGLLISMVASKTRDFSMDEIYYWIGIVLLVLSIVSIFTGVYLYRQLITVARDYTKYMDMDSYDIYRYNKFNDLQAVNSFAMISSLVALGITIITAAHFMIIIIAVIAYLAAFWLTLTSTGIIGRMYPERDLPKAGDKDYAKKLLEASDEGERHIILNGLYKTNGLTTGGLFTAIIILIFYSLLTGESQIFAIILVGVILIISQLKYSLEIREK